MIVAAVSGGLDSVALLWYLLGQDEPVHVHHVIMKTVKSQRGASEGSAMEWILPWMRENRGDFTYSESVYHPGKDRGGYDVTIVSRHIGQMCKENGITPTAYCRGGALHDESAPGIKRRRRAALLEWRSFWPDGKMPPVRFPLSKMGRADIWEMLPAELAHMTASCRKPVSRDGVWVACGECRTCKEMVEDSVPLERAVKV